MSTDKILECDHLKLMTATKQYVCFPVKPFIMLGPVVQNVDNAIHQINHYPVDK